MEKIVSNGDLVSNLPHPRVKYKQLNSLDTPHPIPGHTYTHTRTPNTQGMKLPGAERGRQKERETRTQLAARLRESERERHRKRMLYQIPATNSRPNSLSVKIQVDITRICAER